MSRTRLSPKQQRVGGNYDTLYNLARKKTIRPLPPLPSRQVTFGQNQSFVLLPDNIMAGAIATSLSTGVLDGIQAAKLSTAVGSASSYVERDYKGVISSRVEVRDAATNEVITYNQKEIFLVVQCSDTVTDGQNVNPAGSENLQGTACYEAADGSVAICPESVIGGKTVFIGKPHVLALQNEPVIGVETGGEINMTVTAGGETRFRRLYRVTTSFAAGEALDIATGQGANGGVAELDDDLNDVIPSLGANQDVFEQNDKLDLLWNGVVQSKGDDVSWASATSFSHADGLEVGDTIEIQLLTVA